MPTVNAFPEEPTVGRRTRTQFDHVWIPMVVRLWW